MSNTKTPQLAWTESRHLGQVDSDGPNVLNGTVIFQGPTCSVEERLGDDATTEAQNGRGNEIANDSGAPRERIDHSDDNKWSNNDWIKLRMLFWESSAPRIF